jgi:hypothetical protein
MPLPAASRRCGHHSQMATNQTAITKPTNNKPSLIWRSGGPLNGSNAVTRTKATRTPPTRTKSCQSSGIIALLVHPPVAAALRIIIHGNARLGQGDEFGEWSIRPARSAPPINACDVEHSALREDDASLHLMVSGLVAWERVMADPIESKRRAEECRQLAAIEPDEDDQAFWLRMADEWDKLANLAVRPNEKASPRQNLEREMRGQ